MSKKLVYFLFLAVVFVLAGCQSKYMVKGAGSGAAMHADKATVVFMRPSSFGGAIQSSVYDTATPEDHFIGIVSAHTKIAYAAEPGEHLFMVQAENADFLIAHLEAGKTYYVAVRPRPGMWKARFSLIPIHNDPSAKFNIQSNDFKDWLKSTDWVESKDQAQQWYREHADDVREKKIDYLRKWDAMDASNKAELTLYEKDGVQSSP